MVDYQVHPAKQTPQAKITSIGDSWVTPAQEIPAETVYLVVHPTENMHILCNTSSSSPGSEVDGAVYALAQTHIIECRGATHLYVKTKSGTGTLYWTAFHN